MLSLESLQAPALPSAKVSTRLVAAASRNSSSRCPMEHASLVS